MMDAASIAAVIADYLRDRDDIAAADVIEQPPGVTYATVGVETQAGERYFVNVEVA